MHIGGLIGNSFKLTLQNLSEESASKLSSLHKCSIIFPNYYDSQRFGLPDKPYVTHLVGKSLLDNDLEKAFSYFALGNNISVDSSLSLEDKINYFSSLDSRNYSFYLNSYASYEFNKELSQLLASFNHSSINICEDLSVNLPNFFRNCR